MTWPDFLSPQADDLPFDVEANEPAEETAPEPEPVDLDDLAARMYLPVSFLRELDWLIRDKNAIILAGPPGTGKTFLALHLAALYAHDNVELLQFHPSYSYEDFVQGFKPQLVESSEEGKAAALTYEVTDGPLMRFMEQARSEEEQARADGRPPEPFVLIIDEINRANLAKVFGELFFALEYRDYAVRLQYSPDKPSLSLPKNLWFIGTMNTADRSTSLFDAALRRRFHFVNLDPMTAPVNEVLRKYLKDKHPTLAWVADVTAHVNDGLPDKRYAIGPSHFMREQLDQQVLQRVWDHTIAPYLVARFGEADERAFQWSGVLDAAVDTGLVAREAVTEPAEVTPAATPAEAPAPPAGAPVDPPAAVPPAVVPFAGEPLGDHPGASDTGPGDT